MIEAETIVMAVIEALREVAPAGTLILPSTPVHDVGVDSLDVLEALLALETRTGLLVSEDVVRQLTMELPFGSEFTVDALARTLMLASQKDT